MGKIWNKCLARNILELLFSRMQQEMTRGTKIASITYYQLSQTAFGKKRRVKKRMRDKLGHSMWKED